MLDAYFIHRNNCEVWKEDLMKPTYNTALQCICYHNFVMFIRTPKYPTLNQ